MKDTQTIVQRLIASGQIRVQNTAADYRVVKRTAGHNEKARMCMCRLRAERSGRDTSAFPPRERGPKSKVFHGGPAKRLRKLYPQLTWAAQWKPLDGGGRTWHYTASNGWLARWAAVGNGGCESQDWERRLYIYKASTGEPPEDVTHIMNPQEKGLE